MSAEELEFYRKLGAYEAALQALVQSVSEMRQDIASRMDKVGHLLDVGSARMAEIESESKLHKQNCQSVHATVKKDFDDVWNAIRDIRAYQSAQKKPLSYWLTIIIQTAAVIALIKGPEWLTKIMGL